MTKIDRRGLVFGILCGAATGQTLMSTKIEAMPFDGQIADSLNDPSERT
jgi:hypothetical protein